jgi:hypothetical protein
MGLIPPGFRASFKTSEFYGTLVSMALVVMICAPLNASVAAASVGLLASSFNISRALYKRNRGIYSPAFKSGELALTALAHGFVIVSVLFLGLDRTHATWLMVGTQMVYNIGRGISKGVGVKTQTIMR